MSLLTKYTPVLVLATAAVLSYAVPALHDGVTKLRRGREIERQSRAEQTARQFLADEWRRKQK